MQADGILGMSLSYSNTNHHSVVSNMIAQNLIKQPIFSVFLSDDDSNIPSCVIFGDYDLAKYAKKDNSFEYLNVVNDGYWSIKLDSIMVGGKKILTSSYTAIIDTGTSLIAGPSYEIKLVLNIIEKDRSCSYKDEYLYCSCNNLDDFPDIEFILDGKSFEIKPKNYMMESGSECQLLLVSSQNLRMWILGDVFLRRYYTVFDLGQEKIGLARSINKDKLREDTNITILDVLLWIVISSAIGIIVYALKIIYHHYKNRRPIEPISTPMVEMPLTSK